MDLFISVKISILRYKHPFLIILWEILLHVSMHVNDHDNTKYSPWKLHTDVEKIYIKN